MIDHVLLPHLQEWSRTSSHSSVSSSLIPREERVSTCFALHGGAWDDEKILERYELLYEAGLMPEAHRDGRKPELEALKQDAGLMMRDDHRRILATAIGRLRSKIKYRPVVFELMPSIFTLTHLQETVEALLGQHMHKQNFRRLVESSALVEPTGDMTRTKGRPAALFRFRRSVLHERPSSGLRLSGRG
jgi:hypothetical protein